MKISRIVSAVIIALMCTSLATDAFARGGRGGRSSGRSHSHSHSHSTHRHKSVGSAVAKAAKSVHKAAKPHKSGTQSAARQDNQYAAPASNRPDQQDGQSSGMPTQPNQQIAPAGDRVDCVAGSLNTKPCVGGTR